MYMAREDRRGDDRRAAPRESGFERRIDCAEDGTRRSRSSTPARGGGRREPEAWAARDHRG
ncbi:MAG TPA: hypothetical protein VF613_21070 [Longimicrobium sp.]|jgi:hypothetical protein